MDESKNSENKTGDERYKTNDSDAVGRTAAEGNLAQEKTETANQQTNNANAEHNPSEDNMGWWRKAWGFVIVPAHSNAIVAVFSALLFIATLFYTVFAALQWAANKEAAGAASSAAQTASEALKRSGRSFWLDERPWVTITRSYSEVQRMAINQPIVVPIQVHNVGKTPAKNVAGWARITVFKHLEKPDLSKLKWADEFGLKIFDPQFVKTLPVNAYAPSDTNERKPVILTPDILKGMQDGTMFVLVFGKIVYTDSWKVDHWYQFCDSMAGGITPPGCIGFNDSDENEPQF